MNKDQEKRRHQKRARQKAARPGRVAARQAELAQQAAHRSKVRKSLQMIQEGTPLPVLSDEDYLFWLCHGANYLASDSATGVWNPIFDDIYDGRLPQAEDIARRVLDTYRTADLDENGRFTGVPRTVLAWTVTDQRVVSVYKHEAVRRLQEKNPEGDAEALARAPHNPVVWALMDKVKARSLQAGQQMDEEPAATTPEGVEGVPAATEG